MKLKLISLVFFVLIGTQSFFGQDNPIYNSKNLVIKQVAPQSYIHISYLKTEDFGNVSCNGMVVTNNNEAIVYDTPANEEATKELIDFVQNKLNFKIVAVIPTHFHEDCLAGLNIFHEKNIKSYANKETIDLAKETEFSLPLNQFENSLKLTLGNEVVISQFLGEGHTKDNIIGYFHKDNILFGGCLIKSIGAGKGNLEDANTNAWSETVKHLKTTFPEIKIVIPGHGKIGGIELLDYTIEKFK